jgi:hypothetical protein
MLGCKSSTDVKNTDDPSQNVIPKASKSDVIMTSSSESKGLNFVTSKELKETVSYLASDELQGRDTGTEGIEKAAIYIENKLKSYNVKPYFETYRDNYKAKGKDAFNIIGFIEGNDPKLKEEIIILGAHYDHIGFGKKVGNDSIANGANDNASGTSAVLAMARYFGLKKNNKRSIMFTLYSGEEMGLLGSKHLAEKLKSETINLYTMVNFEMIGVPFKDRDYVAFVTGYDLTNMATKFNEYSGSNLIGFSQVAKQYNLFKASDNYSFYKEFNLPCQTVSSCDLTNFDFYHKVGDEANIMDYEHMSSLINQIMPAIETMSNTPTKEIKMNE